MAGKFYAVKNGRTPGIYNTWDACKAQVDGYGGAIYKSFKTAAEAALYMGWGNVEAIEKSAPETSDDADFVKMNSDMAYGSENLSIQNLSVENLSMDNIDSGKSDGIAYVDGSYNASTREFSYGVVMFHNGEELHFNKSFDDAELSTMRNVAGEIKGAEAAMQYAYERQMKELTIYHDYEGISRWPLREWKANKSGTIAYQNFYDKISKYVHIKFVKVKGHSGDKYNDIADKLAKEALGLD